MFSPRFSRPVAGVRLVEAAACMLAAASLSLLSGCGSGLASSATNTISAATTGLKGTVHGGQQPVTTSRIYLFSVGTTGYGSAGTSLITTGATGVTTDGNGNGYITSDSNGNFNLTQYSCAKAATATSPTYIVAQAGNPGLQPGSISNAAINLISALGPCSGIANIATVNINELSTVAGVTALQQFIGADVFHIGASSANQAGVAVSMLLANDLAPLAGATANTTNIAGNGSVPQAKVNTLANILSDCVNSSSPSSTPCGNLFTNATPPGGTKPGDVFGAMFAIAQNPTKNVNALYTSTQATAPFQPALTAQPIEFSLAITYTNAALTNPTVVAIDAAGDAYVVNCSSCPGSVFAGSDTVVGFSPNGKTVTVVSAGIHKPQALAFDNNGDLWTTDLAFAPYANDEIVKETGSTAAIAYSDPNNILNPEGIAIDATNNAWVADQFAQNVISITNLGKQNALIAAPANSYPSGVGIDGMGNIFASLPQTNQLLAIAAGGASSTAYSPTGFNQPEGITIDSNDFIYTINNSSSLISKVSATGVNATGSPMGEGVSNAQVISLDGLGASWIADSQTGNVGSAGSLLHATAAGVPIDSGLFDSHLNNPLTSAIDPSGNVWVANNGSQSMTEFVGVAAPVITPLAAAVKANKLTTRP